MFAVDDAAIVGGDKSFRALAGNVKKFLQLDGTSQALTQRLAFHELHDEEEFVLCFQEVVNGGNAGLVAHLRGALGFFHEAAAVERIVAQGRGQALESDRAFQTCVASAVNLAHAASADAVFNFKSARNGTGQGIPGGIAIHKNGCRFRHNLQCSSWTKREVKSHRYSAPKQPPVAENLTAFRRKGQMWRVCGQPSVDMALLATSHELG